MSTEDQNTRKLLTVITEAALENSLAHEADELGIHGYTISNARGKGEHGTRNAGWETSGNIRFEVICNAEFARKIARHLQNKYCENYAMILYLSDVEILRPEKF